MRTRIDNPGEADSVNRESYEDADRMFRSGRYRDALRLFEMARDADPCDGQAHLAIGNCWDAIGKPKRAEMAYRQALDLLSEGERSSALFNLGNALFDQRLFLEASKIYRQVPAQTRAYELAQSNLRLALRELGAES